MYPSSLRGTPSERQLKKASYCSPIAAAAAAASGPVIRKGTGFSIDQDVDRIANDEVKQ